MSRASTTSQTSEGSRCGGILAASAVCGGRIARLAAFAALLSPVAAAVAAMAESPPGEPAYLGPSALVVSSDEKILYVACTDAKQVAWVGLPEGRVVQWVDVPGEPTGLALAPGGTRLLVACAAPESTLLVLDADTGKRLDAIPAGHTAMSPVVSLDGRWAYLCNRFSNDVSVIDLEAGQETTRLPAVREPVAAALTGDGRTLLVANHLPLARLDPEYTGHVAAVVTVIDTRTHETAAIPLAHGAHSVRGLHVLPGGRYALITHLVGNFEETPFRVDMGWINVNVVSVVDIPQRRVVRTIGLDERQLGAANPWGIASTPDGAVVGVALAGTGELSLIDGPELLGEFARLSMQPLMRAWPTYVSLGESLWRRHALPGAGPRGLAVAGSKVYVAEYFSDSVAVFDLAGGAPAETAHGARSVSPAEAALEVGPGDRASPVRSIALGPAPVLTPQRWGKMLFNDATLCFEHWQSCASCHPDARMDGLNWDLMNDGIGNFKNTKSMLLAHRTPPSMAEGVRATAEAAVRAGFVHILFSEPPEEESAAIDEYLKALQPVPSPYLVVGRLSPAAERGRELFHSDTVACHACHPAPLYTDSKKYDVGSRNSQDRTGKFVTPTLIEVWRTAPYLHDGRYPTMRELLDEGEHGLSGGRRRKLTDRQIDDLVEFVLSL